MPLVLRTPSGAISLPRPDHPGRFAVRSPTAVPATPPAVPAPVAVAPVAPVAPALSGLEQLGLSCASVAHDFNNLLSVIMVCAGEIAEDDDDAHRERALEIRAAAERGAELTRSLLDHEAPPQPQPAPLALDVELIDSLPLIRRTLELSTEVSLSSGGHVPLVRLAPGELQRMLVNLAANSREAMPGGGSVAIRTAVVQVGPGDPVLPTGWCVRISFADSGTGMTPEIAHRAVHPHFSTKADRRGAGLGLAIVLALARSRGGDLRISSLPGSGTSVAIYLPAVRADGQALSLRSPAAAPA